MKIADFDNAVRDLITDAVGGDGDAGDEYRWTPATLLLWVNEGRKQLFGLRPEAFYVSGIVRRYPGDLLANKDIDLDPVYDAQLVNYCVFRCLSRDNEDPETGALAKGYYSLFLNGV
jgi:hypothetical protein